MKTPKPVAERKYDAIAIRNLVTSEIKRSKKSREQIAEGISRFTGDKVTVRMLNAYTSDAAEQHRWPAQYDIAFCEVVGNFRLLRERAKRAGLLLVGPEEERLIALGKAWEQKCRAERILSGGAE
jgi:hypothetical protein